MKTNKLVGRRVEILSCVGDDTCPCIGMVGTIEAATKHKLGIKVRFSGNIGTGYYSPAELRYLNNKPVKL